MRRGVSAGGGQSSLGYLFGSGEDPKPQAAPKNPTNEPPSKPSAAPKNPTNDPSAAPKNPTIDPFAVPQPADSNKQTPAGAPGSKTNNYFRADGQNCGNFLTDRPTTKVHAAPGGGSSLNYLFGDANK